MRGRAPRVRTAIAGAHWLGDWGRDAMIARAAANMRITPKHGVVK